MTTRKDFSPDEWTAIHRGATGAGMLVSLSDRDFTDSFGEASAMSKYLAGQQVAGSTELTRDIAHERGTGFGLTTSPEKLRVETMAALTAAISALKAKSPDDVEPYRAFVLGLANTVANAKGGGTSTVEAQMISEITQALGS
jgi:hypothetical protein